MISISNYATVENLPKYKDIERFKSNRMDIIYIQYDVFGKNRKYSMEIYNKKWVMRFFVNELKENDFLFGDTLIKVREEIKSHGKEEFIELYKGTLTMENYEQACQILKKFENKDFEPSLINKLTELTQKDGYSITSINKTEECNVCADYTTHTININIELKKKEIKILDKKEKEYLENVIRPFRDKIKWITKYEWFKNNEYIAILVKYENYIELPNFKSGTMYKGMQVNKGYTIEELELFKG